MWLVWWAATEVEEVVDVKGGGGGGGVRVTCNFLGTLLELEWRKPEDPAVTHVAFSHNL